ncbi:hypothetical protein HYS95_02410 [Candidatus Daviesbacteria bacterium]|nr:hypothetical protein [Candidatus Daviesbacteria bacterium]
MKIKIAQVIGLNTDQQAAQVTSEIREGNGFFAVLKLSSDDAFTKGRQALSELEDFFFETEGGPAQKLQAVFEEAGKKFPDTEFDLCLASVWGKVLYLLGKGQVEVYLKRNEKLSPLLSMGNSGQLVSGFVNAGDKVMFATNSLVVFLGDELNKCLNLPSEMFEEEIGSKIGASQSENDGLAALVIEIEEEQAEITPLPDESEQNLQPEKVAQSFQSVFDKEKFAFVKVLVSKLPVLTGKVRQYFPKSGRSRLILAVTLLFIIAGGAAYQYKVSRDQKINTDFNQALQQAKDDFNSAKGLAALNPSEARNKLESAKNKINQALSIKTKSVEAQNFKKLLEDETPSILQQSSVADFPVFLDLDLVKKDFKAQSLSMSSGKLLLLDPNVKTLVMVDLVKKSNKILAGASQLGEAEFASLNGSMAFVYSEDKGIIRVDSSNSKVTAVAKTDEDWGKITDIYGFAGNVYALDTLKNQIWKYLPTSEGYSDKREYLTKGTSADFASAQKIQIESSIYVLKRGGEVLRFTKGDKDNFSYSGLPSGVKEPKSIFISSDTDNLYVLDSGNSRLLVLSKLGEYKSQITGNKFSTVTDLAVDEVTKKVYLLEGSKIYSIDLR